MEIGFTTDNATLEDARAVVLSLESRTGAYFIDGAVRCLDLEVDEHGVVSANVAILDLEPPAEACMQARFVPLNAGRLVASRLTASAVADQLCQLANGKLRGGMRPWTAECAFSSRYAKSQWVCLWVTDDVEYRRRGCAADNDVGGLPGALDGAIGSWEVCQC